MRKASKQYFHTINGKPGRFNGEQIIYAGRSLPLVESLEQIKREQRASREFCERVGATPVEYGYLRATGL